MTKAIAYLMGVDPPGGGNTFFTEARGYFGAKGATIKAPPAGGFFTLKDVLEDLARRAAATPPEIFDRIHIVTHATMFGGVSFGLDPVRALFRGLPFLDVGLLRLTHAEATKPSSDFLKPLSSPAVTPATTIQIDGCDVGRDLEFVKLFGQMFGLPGRVLASRRVLQFFHQGTTFRAVPCRTWSVVMNSPQFPPASAAGWPAIRAAFVSAATAKFAMKASENDPLGFDTFESAMKTKTASATTAMSMAPYFMAEGFDISWEFEEKPADDAAALARILPATKSKIATGPDVDDTTVATVVTGRDFVISGTDFPSTGGRTGRRLRASARVVMLAEPMGVDADASNRDHYAEVTIAPPKLPTPGPTVPAGSGPPPGQPTTPPPAGANTPSPPHAGLIDTVRAELVAAGADTVTLDALVAGLVAGEPAAPLTEADLSAPPVLPERDVPSAGVAV